MDAERCLISGCTVTPDSVFTVNDNGLLTVYSACTAHLAAIQNGSMFLQPDDPTRGFIGLREP